MTVYRRAFGRFDSGQAVQHLQQVFERMGMVAVYQRALAGQVRREIVHTAFQPETKPLVQLAGVSSACGPVATWRC